MSKDTFWYRCQTYGEYFEATTQLQRPFVSVKRIAIVLHWLTQASSFLELAALMPLASRQWHQ